MQMSNSCQIPASVSVTWQALNDSQFLKTCIAGCESIDLVEENKYKVLLAAKIGPVSARFVGHMVLDELNPPKSYTINFEGQGGAAGFAKGSARVFLLPNEEDTMTHMSYEVQASVGGKLAQIGSRLIDGAAKKVADDFFAAFVVAIAALQEEAVSQPDELTSHRIEEIAHTNDGGFSPSKIGWVAGALITGAGLAWYFAKHLL